MDNNENFGVTETDATVTESPTVENSDTSAETETDTVSEVSNEGSTEATEVKESTGNQEQTVPYNRFKDKVDEVNRYKAELESLRSQQAQMSMTPEQREQAETENKARDALSKLGFVTREEVQRQADNERAKNMFISECNRLEGKYDGKDGNPKFNPMEIAQYMDELRAKGQVISDPETAYKLKNMDALIENGAKSMRSSNFSEAQGGGMNQVNDTYTAELNKARKTGDFADMLKKYAPMPD